MTLSLDVAILADPWRKVRGARQIVARAIDASRTRLGLDDAGAEVCVVLCDDAEIRRLNKSWRGKDKSTNVLSFPAAVTAGPRRHFGDIAIAYETVAKEALREKKPLSAHLTHMAVHGFLHLAGYDHECDTDAETMEDLEREILASLGIADPYRLTMTGAESSPGRRHSK